MISVSGLVLKAVLVNCAEHDAHREAETIRVFPRPRADDGVIAVVLSLLPASRYKPGIAYCYSCCSTSRLPRPPR